jgi:hypothetical protein
VSRALDTLCGQLEHERHRADRAEAKAAALQAELIEVRIAERAAVELAQYATGEVADLRKRLDASEKRADAERTRAELRVAMRPWWRRWFRW